MPATINANNPSELRQRNSRAFTGTIDLDNSYPAGGYSLDGIDPNLDMVIITGGTRFYEFDKATNKLVAYIANATTGVKEEVTAAVDLSGETGLEYYAIQLFQ